VANAGHCRAANRIAKITRGYRLPARNVITRRAGVAGRRSGEDELLRRATAPRWRWRSSAAALGGVSGGLDRDAYAFPADRAARIAVGP